MRSACRLSALSLGKASTASLNRPGPTPFGSKPAAPTAPPRAWAAARGAVAGSQPDLHRGQAFVSRGERAAPGLRGIGGRLGRSVTAAAMEKGPEMAEAGGFRIAARERGLLDQAVAAVTKCESPEGADGPPFAEGESEFRLPEFLAALSTETFGRTLLMAARMPSTQSFLQANPHNLPDGVVLVADQQAKGKGRGGNSWVSPAGCLMFSACKSVACAGQQLPFLQYVVALSVVQAAQDAAAEAAGPGSRLSVRIKWPNDLYMGKHKVGGVLCNSSYRDGKFLVVLGVGLNVSNREPTTCLNAELVGGEAAAERGSQQPGETNPISAELMLAKTLNRLELNFRTFVDNGFGPLEPMYLASWLHSQQQVILEEDDPRDPSGPKREVPLTVQGLTPSGFLLAVDAYGSKYELHPDGNSFDFFKGLVRKKIY